MKNFIKKLIEKIFKLINLKIIKLTSYEIIAKLPRSFYIYAVLPKVKQDKVFTLLAKSKSKSKKKAEEKAAKIAVRILKLIPKPIHH